MSYYYKMKGGAEIPFEKLEERRDGSLWKVKWPDGKIGYIKKSYVMEVDENRQRMLEEVRKNS